MGLFEQIKHQSSTQPVNRQMDPKQVEQSFRKDLEDLKTNPVAYAKAHGKNIPNGMTDPGQIVQYLLNSTQVNNPRYQMALRLLGGIPSRR